MTCLPTGIAETPCLAQMLIIHRHALVNHPSCSCAGIFNAPYAIESYAQVFEEENALERLESFASEYGPAFYGLPLNESSIKLVRKRQMVPKIIELNSSGSSLESIVPFHAGETLNWSILNKSNSK